MRTIFLMDIDCFFASVEMAIYPELRGKPLCIGGRRGDRGIIACPNYEARAYGVRTAMPIRSAERMLPPDAVFLRGNYRLYSEYSDRVMNILNDFTPDVEQVSVDEAYMDVTGCLHFWNHDPVRMATAIKDQIWNECGLRVSIGIASNKVCAKIAAGLEKPNGLVFVPAGKEREFLAPLPIEVVPGVGKKTLPKMHARGIYRVADVLKQNIGQHSWIARYLTSVPQGMDGRVIRSERVEKSISRDTTFSQDSSDSAFITSTLYYLTERCCKTLRKRNQIASTVTVKIRHSNFKTLQKQTTLARGTANEEEFFTVVRHMVRELLPVPRSLRLIGVKVSHIVLLEEAAQQLELDMTQSGKREDLHRRLDTLQDKHGYTTIRWGITTPLNKQFALREEEYELHNPVYGM